MKCENWDKHLLFGFRLMSHLRNDLPDSIQLHMQAGQPLEYCEIALSVANGNFDLALRPLSRLPRFDPIGVYDPHQTRALLERDMHGVNSTGV